MKTKTSDLIAIALDWAVAQAEGNVRLQYDSREGLIISNVLGWIPYRPSVAWQQGGPIIEREKIEVTPWGVDGLWRARDFYEPSPGVPCSEEYGPTPLVAAMRCYVMSKLGNEIEIPEEL